jgi:DNA-binding LacI/PurR family transcriptional regulator
MEHKDYKKLLEDLNKAQISIPIISNGLIENPILPTITFDGYSGGFVAAECFDQRNMKKVGIVKGPSGKAESSFRANGFKDYCMHHNLEVVWEVQGDFTFDSGYKSFESFQHSIQQPQGIFFSNDLMAAGFSIAATNAGLQIPRDVSIIGYDNLPVCYQLQPNLSSIETDFEELGRLSIPNLARFN